MSIDIFGTEPCQVTFGFKYIYEGRFLSSWSGRFNEKKKTKENALNMYIFGENTFVFWACKAIDARH